MNVGKSVNERNIPSRQVLRAVLANHNAPFRRLWANFCATLEPVYGKYAAVQQFSIWRPPSYHSPRRGDRHHFIYRVSKYSLEP